jgi:hypothetical protein
MQNRAFLNSSCGITKNSLTYPQRLLRKVVVALESDLKSVVEAGMGLVAGTVSDDGEPRAHRAWSARVVDPDEGRIRFVMSADDPDVVAHLETGAVSLTGANVATYASTQVKGRPVVVEAPTADDMEDVRKSTDAFFDVIHSTDGNPIELLSRMLPRTYLAVEMVVDETFDQTPGPKAGAPWTP